jgi:hypothetical protein
MSQSQIRRMGALAGMAVGLSGIPVHDSVAQGCEPIRFTTPNTGMPGGPIHQAHQWRVTLGYRYLYSDQWFVGSSEASGQAPGGRSPLIRTHTLVADVEYAVSNRLAVHAAVPFSTGKIRRVYPLYDTNLHQQTANGIGDAGVSAELWMLDPGTHQAGNFALGGGIQLPTGTNDIAGTWYTASGPVQGAADGSIQPGSGGWGFTLQGRGFVKIVARTFGYLGASYTLTPQAHSDVRWKPADSLWAIADGYSARAGLAHTLLPNAGLSLSLGGRIDGTPVHDVFGGGDEAYRRPGNVIYVDPGIALNRGKNSVDLNVPVRLHANRLKNELEQQSGTLNGGGFAKALIFLSYSRRL